MHSVIKKRNWWVKSWSYKQIMSFNLIKWTESNEIEKEVPLELPNPNYPKFKKSNQHLQDIAISDCDI